MDRPRNRRLPTGHSVYHRRLVDVTRILLVCCICVSVIVMPALTVHATSDPHTRSSMNVDGSGQPVQITEMSAELGLKQSFSPDRTSRTQSHRPVGTNRNVNGPEPPSAYRDCPIHQSRTSDARGSDEAGLRIVELVPNPTTDWNVGEYLVIEAGSVDTIDNVTISDGHTTARIPDGPVPDRFAVSMDPAITENKTSDPVIELDGTIRLAVDGDRLELNNGSRTKDVVRYTDAPEGHRWYRTDDSAENDTSIHGNASRTTDPVRSTTDANTATGEWWPREATCFGVTTASPESVTPFVLPDSPAVPIDHLRSAEERLLLAGYTITDEAIVTELVEAATRGVSVSVLLEAGPVGGVPEPTESAVSELIAAGIEVRAMGGPGARYRYHHPKYAIADDSVMVLTENWKPSGVGGTSSRGWGVTVDDASIADDLATVFRADFEGWDTTTAEVFLETATFVDDDSPVDPIEGRYGVTPMAVDSVELVLAPDNAASRLRTLIDDAEDRILIKQPRIADPDFELLAASVDAARRGVTVQILLDSSWYIEDDNENFREELEAIATNEELPIEVRLVDAPQRFGKIHAKGIVIDDETTVVGSVNWNDNSLFNNREVSLVIHGEAVTSFYAGVFLDDWEASSPRNIGNWILPFELSVTVILALVGGALVGRRYVRFGVPAVDREALGYSAAGDDRQRRVGVGDQDTAGGHPDTSTDLTTVAPPLRNEADVDRIDNGDVMDCTDVGTVVESSDRSGTVEPPNRRIIRDSEQVTTASDTDSNQFTDVERTESEKSNSEEIPDLIESSTATERPESSSATVGPEPTSTTERSESSSTTERSESSSTTERSESSHSQHSH